MGWCEAGGSPSADNCGAGEENGRAYSKLGEEGYFGVGHKQAGVVMGGRLKEKKKGG